MFTRQNNKLFDLTLAYDIFCYKIHNNLLTIAEIHEKSLVCCSNLRQMI